MKFNIEVDWQLYQTELTRFYRDQYPLDDDLKELILWTATYNPKNRPESEVRRAVSILPYYQALKAHFPAYADDHEMPEILPRVALAYDTQVRTISPIGVVKTCKIATQVREVEKAAATIPDYPKLDLIWIDIFCALVRHNPLESAMWIAEKAISIKSLVQPYLSVWPSRNYDLDGEMILTCAWVAENHPNIEYEKAFRWVKDIVQSAGYQRIKQKFPPIYPFSEIAFSIDVLGKVELRITSLTYLSAASLAFFTNRYPNARLNFQSVFFDFDLNHQNLHDFTRKIKKIFKEIENELYPHDANDFPVKDSLFSKAKAKFLIASHQFVEAFLAGFPGKKYLLTEIPSSTAVAQPSASTRDMLALMRKYDFKGMELVLAGKNKKFNPNQKSYAFPLLHHCLERVSSYEVHLLYGAPHIDQLKEVSRWPHLYKVIIAKLPEGYFLYQRNSNINLIKPELITSSEDIAYLDQLREPFFRNQPEKSKQHLYSPNDSDIQYRLTLMILPYVQETLEVQRQSEAEQKLAMLKLFMEYGADPTYKCAGYNLTAFESLIESTKLQYFDLSNPRLVTPDFANAWLLRKTILVLMRADRGCSQIWVHSSYREDQFIGEFIQGCTTELENEKRPVKELPLISAVDFIKNLWGSLEIKNTKNQGLLHQLKPLHALSPDNDLKGMRELYLSRFRKLTTKSDDQLNIEFDNELQLNKASTSVKSLTDKQYDIVDLLRNKNNEIVGFNIARIFVPYDSSNSIIHLVPLACCDETVSHNFSRVMSILSFHYTVYLKCAYPNQPILTVFSASSAVNYLQTVGLDEVYPKYDCIPPHDMVRIEQLCYHGKAATSIGWRKFYKTDLQYEIKPREQDSSKSKAPPMLTDSDLHREGFNARMALKGHETVVAFYATDENMVGLANRIDQKLNVGLSFFEIGKKTASLTDAVMRSQNMGSKL